MTPRLIGITTSVATSALRGNELRSLSDNSNIIENEKKQIY